MVIVFNRHAARTSAPDVERLIGTWSAGARDGGYNTALREPPGFLPATAPGFWARVAHAVGHGIGMPEAGHLGPDLLAL